MGRTLEEWFAELDKLLEARDRFGFGWVLQRDHRATPPRGRYSLLTHMQEELGVGDTREEAVRNACANLMETARRVLLAAAR
jgi:hypothetical protein